MKLCGVAPVLVAGVVAAAPVDAHHSFTLHFVPDKPRRSGEYVYPYDCDPSHGE